MGENSTQESIEIVLHEKSLLGLRLKPSYRYYDTKIDKSLVSINIIAIEPIKKGLFNEIVQTNLQVGDKLTHIDEIPVSYMKYKEALHLMKTKRPIKLVFLKKSSKEGFLFVNRNDTALEELNLKQKSTKLTADTTNHTSIDSYASKQQPKTTKYELADYENALESDKDQINKICFYNGVLEIEGLRLKVWKRLFNISLTDEKSYFTKYKEQLLTFLGSDLESDLSLRRP